MGWYNWRHNGEYSMIFMRRRNWRGRLAEEAAAAGWRKGSVSLDCDIAWKVWRGSSGDTRRQQNFRYRGRTLKQWFYLEFERRLKW